MPHYSLYFIDRYNGHIERIERFDAPTAIAANAFARQKMDGHPVELWEGSDKLARLEPESSGSHVLRVWQRRASVNSNEDEPLRRP